MRRQLFGPLRAVNAGFAKLNGLFDAGVRARAVPYVTAGVEVMSNDELLLAGRVRGTDVYRAAFARSGDSVRYGCSCPYFMDGQEGCKHLWALVLHATDSKLVEGAASAKRFMPSLLPWITSGQLDDDDEVDDGDDDDDDEVVDDDDRDGESELGDETETSPPDDGGSSSKVSELARMLQAQIDRYEVLHGLRARGVGAHGWRSLDVGVTREPARVELVYLLAPDAERSASGQPAFELVLGQRALSGAGAEQGRALVPACSLAPDALAHALDRQLLAMLQGLRAGHDLQHRYSSYGYSPPSYAPQGYWHVVRLSGWALRPVLELVAETGRGHIAPPGVALDEDESWRAFKTGSKTRGRGRAAVRIDYSAFLAWPVLERDSGDPWELELRLDTGSSKRARGGAYAIGAKLVRGDETLSADRIAFADPSGTAIAENRLVALPPSDARWLANLRRSPEVLVPSTEIPDFARLACGRNGVSRFALPPGYVAEETREPPRKRLELLAPGSRATDGEIYFEYGTTRVRAEDPGRLVFLPEQRVLARDLDLERQAFDELQSAGFAAKTSSLAAPRAGAPEAGKLVHVSVPNDSLIPAVHALIEKGWHVYGEGKRYRALQDFDIEFESGLDWFGLTGRARFADGPSDVPFPRLLRALKAQRRVVELGDGSRGILPDEWAARFEQLAELVPDKKEELRFSTRQLGMLEVLCAAAPEASGSEALQGLRQTLARFERVEPRRAPAGFRGELRQYQAAGLGWLHAVNGLGFGACLADDMGLGKTIQVLAHLYAVHRSDAPRPDAAEPSRPSALEGSRARRAKGSTATTSPRRSLVVVPRSLLGNWQAEAQRFAPDLRVHVHWGKERGKPGARWGQGDDAAEIILTTYGTLRLDAVELAKHSFETIVLDEAQAIKNDNSATARAAKLLRGQRRIAMSGTPVENHVGELWSLFEFLNPGLLGELPGLKQALGRGRPSPRACDLIQRAVRPFILRRTKREVAKDLPDRIEQTLYVELEKDERAHYDELARHYRERIGKKLRELGPERSTPHVLEALLRLRQAACHAGLIDRSRDHESSAKIDLLLEQLRSVRAEGHKALVFSQFTSLLAIVRRRLEEEGVTFEYLDGKTTDRAERVERFQNDPSLGVFLISLKAGGVGLNLTAADYVFILDPWWNPAVEAQAIDRAHRIGQKRTVIAYRLLTRGTVEERVAELQAQKRELVEALMGDGALSAKLTRDDLEALLELGER